MEENNESFIFVTSGSTGVPKTVNKSCESLINEARDLTKIFNFSTDTMFVSTVSPDYMYGTTFTVMFPKQLQCSVDLERVIYPEDIKDYEKFVFVSTPSFLEKLYKYNFMFKHKPEMIFSAGAKLSDEIFEYLEKISNGVTEIYGSTEAGVIAYRQKHDEKFKFFPNVKYNNGKISSPYFDEAELELNDELEFFEDGFLVKCRNDKIVKIQEKRISLVEMENILNSSKFVEKSNCLKLKDKLCSAIVLTKDGQKFLEEHGKLELTKVLKEYFLPVANSQNNLSLRSVFPKKWRFLPDLPLNERGKIDENRIREWFNTDVTYPNVVGFLNDGQVAEIDLIFPKNSNFFKGHFPEFPILPGVVQLFFAKELSRDIFNLDFVPKKVKKVKFSSIIKPDTKVKLVLTRSEKSIEYKFVDCKDIEKVFSSGNFVL